MRIVSLQGRLYVVREYSIRTRIKTFTTSQSADYCGVREYSIRTRIKTSKVLLLASNRIMSESIPLEQGLRLEVFLLPVAQRCQRAFHQNKDLRLFEERMNTHRQLQLHGRSMKEKWWNRSESYLSDMVKVKRMSIRIFSPVFPTMPSNWLTRDGNRHTRPVSNWRSW